jgi:exosortase A-associated hydrolase 2
MTVLLDTHLHTQSSGQPFFLDASGGPRLCVYYAPPSGTRIREAVIYLHPFCNEMNKSRRMASLQARAMAHEGVAVLQIDLYGCGDSSGDFADALWDIWKEDVSLAHRWLDENLGVPVSLWGLRMGALLALDYASGSVSPIPKLILWQPGSTGESYITQFLRMRIANEMLTPDSGKSAASSHGTQGLRNIMKQGQSLEIAGYELVPALAEAIDKLKIASLAPRGSKVAWFEIVADVGRNLPPVSQQILAEWRRQDVSVESHCVVGLPFWATQEITECPALLQATTTSFSAGIS